jgi:signal transduction histidine kinase
MKRAPSALVSIGGFGVAVAALSVATTAAIVLVAPPPPQQRITVTQAIMALQGPVPGFERRVATSPPVGPSVAFAEGLIAEGLGRPAGDVRVARLDPAASLSVRVHSSPDIAATRIDKAGLSNPIILRASGTGDLQELAPGALSAAIGKVLIDVPLPAYAASLRQPDGRWLVVQPVRPFLSGWQRSILIALSVSLLLLAPLAWFYARRLTRPFRAIAGALRNDAAEVPQEGPRELREAAAAIAAMQNRLAIEAAERARMLTAIAHDLRTPLTGLRLRIEATPEPQRARMVADVERMQAMIDEVLTFARDAAAPRVMVDVRTLITTIVQDMGERGAAIRLLPGDDAMICVPEPAFRRAVENLLRNAIDYAGGGTVTIEGLAEFVAVVVTDSGPGIPAADRERLLRPFERGDASRNRATGGAGLGLSIVSDFAAQNRGEFTLATGHGGGTIAMLKLPCERAGATEA